MSQNHIEDCILFKDDRSLAVRVSRFKDTPINRIFAAQLLGCLKENIMVRGWENGRKVELLKFKDGNQNSLGDFYTLTYDPKFELNPERFEK